MRHSVKKFLDKYEWGYPFDHMCVGDYLIDGYLLQKQLDTSMVRQENRRFAEPISIGKTRPEEICRTEKRRFLGF